MSRGLQATRRRMRSVETTKKITKAMELVATAKLKTWKDKMLQNASYTSSMLSFMQEVFAQVEETSSPFLKENEAEKDLYLVVSSTLGLCGGYNYNLFKTIDQHIREQDDVIFIGAKGYYHYKLPQERATKEYLSLNDSLDYNAVRKLADQVLHEYQIGKYQHVYLIYTHYVNSLTFVPEVLPILPLSMVKEENIVPTALIMEPSASAIMEELIPLYVKSVLFGKLLETMVSEQASRRTAMENATNNAEEILSNLQLEYNKERQAQITQEITEVVGGALGK